MPLIADRKVHDDAGNELAAGSLVLINGLYKRILHFDKTGEVDIADFSWENVETIEAIPAGLIDSDYETTAKRS